MPSRNFLKYVLSGGFAALLTGCALLSSWRDRNAVLARIVERIPEERLNASCTIGDGSPVTLQFLIEDYLRHLDHHVDQIVGAAGA